MTTCGCAWPVSFAEGECEALTGLPPEEQAIWIQVASDLLYAWTNQVFGVCPVEVRPCQQGCSDAGWSTYWGRGPGCVLVWAVGLQRS